MTLSRYTGSMNSMFERLGALLKERLEGDEQDIFKDSKKINAEKSFADEEIKKEDFSQKMQTEKASHSEEKTEEKLGEKAKANTKEKSKTSTYSQGKGSFSFDRSKQDQSYHKKAYTIYKAESLRKPMPKAIQKDFDFLALCYSASLEECKERYKKLIKAYHTDKHSSDLRKQKNATEHSAKINAAFNRIRTWFETN